MSRILRVRSRDACDVDRPRNYFLAFVVFGVCLCAESKDSSEVLLFFLIIIPFVDSVLVFLLLDPSGDSFFGIIELHSWVSSCFAGEIRSRNSALERSLRRLFLLS